MSRIAIIKHKGKDILYADHRGLKGEKLVENIRVTDKTFIGSDSDEILAITDFRDVYLDEQVMASLKSDNAKKAMKRIKKYAVLGAFTGFKKVIFNGYNALTGNKGRVCGDEEEAKEWVVK